ncbi:MAG: hypothetical protein ACI4OJ_07435 [Lachnospiraceae bacterium]
MCNVEQKRTAAKSIRLQLDYGFACGPYDYSSGEVVSHQLLHKGSLAEFAAREHGIDPSHIISCSISISRQKDTIYITEHAMKRMKQRAGWNRNAAVRMTKKAVEKGKSADEVTGRLGAWLRHKALEEEGPGNWWYRVYGNFIFVFADQNLVTVFQRPCHGSYFMRCTMKTEYPERPTGTD